MKYVQPMVLESHAVLIWYLLCDVIHLLNSEMRSNASYCKERFSLTKQSNFHNFSQQFYNFNDLEIVVKYHGSFYLSGLQVLRENYCNIDREWLEVLRGVFMGAEMMY